MKVTDEHYEAIEAAIVHFVQSRQGPHRKHSIEDSYRELDMTPERLRWDLWHSAKGHTHTTREIGRYAFDYNDSHLDTAFRKALYVIGFEWGAA